MSNVRSLNVNVLAREAVAHLEHRAAFVHCYQRQQEVAHEARGWMRRARLQTAGRFLGRPSVGGRLTAGASRRSSQVTAVLSVRASVQVGRMVPVRTRMARSAFAYARGRSLRALVRPSKLTQ